MFHNGLDVILQLHCPLNYSLSPRATVSTPTNLQKRDGRMSSSPILPLPDPASGIDWSNLVDAATKAFEEHGK